MANWEMRSISLTVYFRVVLADFPVFELAQGWFKKAEIARHKGCVRGDVKRILIPPRSSKILTLAQSAKPLENGDEP